MGCTIYICFIFVHDEVSPLAYNLTTINLGTVYFMDWSHRLESWSEVLESILGVEPWNETLD